MILGNSDNMMALQFNAATTALVVVVPALLACEIVALQNGTGKGSEFGSVIDAALTALPVAVVLPALCAVGIVGLSLALVPRGLTLLGLNPSLPIFGVASLKFSNVAPIIVRLVSRLKAHTGKCRAILFGQAFVPRFSGSESRLSAIGMVASLVLGIFERVEDFAATAFANLGLRHVSYLREDIELFAVHYTGNIEGKQGKERELLEHPESHNRHNVAGNGKRDGVKSVMDWAISSQAIWKQVEGSTTRVWSLNPQGHGGKTPRVRSPKGMM